MDFGRIRAVSDLLFITGVWGKGTGVSVLGRLPRLSDFSLPIRGPPVLFDSQMHEQVTLPGKTRR